MIDVVYWEPSRGTDMVFAAQCRECQYALYFEWSTDTSLEDKKIGLQGVLAFFHADPSCVVAPAEDEEY